MEETAERRSRTISTHHLSIVQTQLTSAERAVLRAFLNSEIMLELYLASECSSRDVATPTWMSYRPGLLKYVSRSAPRWGFLSLWWSDGRR